MPNYMISSVGWPKRITCVGLALGAGLRLWAVGSKGSAGDTFVAWNSGSISSSYVFIFGNPPTRV